MMKSSVAKKMGGGENGTTHASKSEFSPAPTSLPAPFFSRPALSLMAGSVFLGVLCIGLVLPLARLVEKSLTNGEGTWVGLANFITYCTTPGLVQALQHTLFVGFTVTAVTLGLAFLIAYAYTHTCFHGKHLCRMGSLLPLFVPSLFPALGLIYLFGNQGIFNDMLGDTPFYGPLGIVLGCIVYTLPHAVLLLCAALQSIDDDLYLAAQTLGAGPWKRFRTITLPSARYGITSAGIVIFVLTITDFGIPKVLGGDYNMLATEVFTQVIGLNNFNMGATVSLVLLLPALAAFGLDQWALRQQRFKTKGRAHSPQPAPLRDTLFTLAAWAGVALPLCVLGMVVYGAFIAFWPYDLSLSFANFSFQESPYGVTPFWNSILMALGVAVIGTVCIFCGTYITERCPLPRWFTAVYRILAILPLGIPGTVLGLAFVITFNSSHPLLQLFSGGMGILIANSVIHFYTVCHFTASGGLSRLSPQYEMAGATLGVSYLGTFTRVIVPLQRETITTIAFYLFVNALTTISAVVFLYTANTLPASVSILQMADSGKIAEASAMGTLLLAAALLARLAQTGLHRYFARQS